ncbi:ParA family protein [Ideonella livida]|uniref:ParA family protein n=1 Tax=Ideonella livida TaxID=2707176 RepID=A0A7C9PFB4_9BURK|nr:ParA family protein [Ideonella livida]NDY90497.1 ParA family protein [Ideonella livida]
MGRVLAITNRKGGSGKTSCAVNLAAEWAAALPPRPDGPRARVLLVDLDSQGHCAVGLGVQPARGAPTVHGFLAGRHALRPAIVPTPVPGLDLVPADPLFEHGQARPDERTLARALREEGLAEAYEVILLDTPPSLDLLLLNALCAAERVVVPLMPHHLSAEGVKQLARLMFRVSSQGLNPQLRLLGFLPVMLDGRIGVHRQVLADLGRQFGPQRLLPGIRNDIRVAEAFGAGKPVRLHAPGARATADFGQALQALRERWV